MTDKPIGGTELRSQTRGLACLHSLLPASGELGSAYSVRGVLITLTLGVIAIFMGLSRWKWTTVARTVAIRERLSAFRGGLRRQNVAGCVESLRNCKVKSLVRLISHLMKALGGRTNRQARPPKAF